jgi:hypothetical protein
LLGAITANGLHFGGLWLQAAFRAQFLLETLLITVVPRFVPRLLCGIVLEHNLLYGLGN